MRHIGNLAIVGSGPSAVYLLNQIASLGHALSGTLDSITILEKSSIAGCGMPYNPETTDIYNMSNISSAEIPALPQSLCEWLRGQDAAQLREWGINPAEIDGDKVYARLALGAYFHAQYRILVSCILAAGIPFTERTGCMITDIFPDESDESYHIQSAGRERMTFSSVVIATGHLWSESDDPANGYYSSPWPISKIIPAEGDYHDFRVGTLGASLSAFDVLTSLSHRHGKFRKSGDALRYHPLPGAENFRVAMHSANGMLPHLQYDQKEPLREIYRHASRSDILSLRNADGMIRIADYFDKVCRPALLKAFDKDDMPEVSAKLRSPGFGFADFVELMSDEHEYADAFEGMRHEMEEARESVENHKPIHWKETIDDLMYALNFHAEMMPAEDHQFFSKTVMPFLMNVIAAMPLPSAELLLAMHDAGKLEMVTGRVDMDETETRNGTTTITVEEEGKKREMEYRMFIDCGGQDPLELDDFPFPGLVEAGCVRRARAEFVSKEHFLEMEGGEDGDRVFREGGRFLLHTGGVDIDCAYRLISADGTPCGGLYDLAFPHTSGVRPYSYGLQACNATAEIVAAEWLRAIQNGNKC